MAADQDRVLLLLQGQRSRSHIIIFHGMDEGAAHRAPNLIVENHECEIKP